MVGMGLQRNPVMRESDSLNELMRQFCDGCHRVVLQDETGLITKVISQYNFLRFFDSNIHFDWFPGLLNSPVLTLNMIITRYVLFYPFLFFSILFAIFRYFPLNNA